MSAFDPEVADINDECIAQFADQFEFFHSGPDVAFTMCGIFTSALQREEVADAASFHRVFCRASDFTVAPKNGDLVRTAGKEYTVINVTADHGGGILLSLNLNLFL
jgi:hypothetical protein